LTFAKNIVRIIPASDFIKKILKITTFKIPEQKFFTHRQTKQNAFFYTVRFFSFKNQIE